VGARILVIEDNVPNLELMTYLLGAYGHTTETARDGEAGVAKARRGGFDLIICDIQLPKLDGLEVAQALGNGGVPLIAVTAFAQVGDREKILAGGFQGYISKPIAPETFVHEVEAFLPSGLHSTGYPSGQESSAPLGLRSRQTGGPAILVVDNVPSNVDLLRTILEACDYAVTAAVGVEEAVAHLRGHTPDLILSDVHLQDGTGYDILGVVRTIPRLGAVPFLFLSSTAQREDERARALSLGARKFILRPIEPEALLLEIQECLAP
jgi:two-component system cell cycle response regulator